MLVVHQMALSFMLIKYDDKTLNSFRYISFCFLFLSFFFVHAHPRAHSRNILACLQSTTQMWISC